jgi:hypothetical protein
MENEDYEEREVGSSERHYGWGEQNISSVLKVPRHCPFVGERSKLPLLTWLTSSN